MDVLQYAMYILTPVLNYRGHCSCSQMWVYKVRPVMKKNSTCYTIAASSDKLNHAHHRVAKFQVVNMQIIFLNPLKLTLSSPLVAKWPPFIQVGGLGEHCNLPQWVQAEPRPKQF